jgi:hypothetical protein
MEFVFCSSFEMSTVLHSVLVTVSLTRCQISNLNSWVSCLFLPGTVYHHYNHCDFMTQLKSCVQSVMKPTSAKTEVAL